MDTLVSIGVLAAYLWSTVRDPVHLRGRDRHDDAHVGDAAARRAGSGTRTSTSSRPRSSRRSCCSGAGSSTAPRRAPARPCARCVRPARRGRAWVRMPTGNTEVRAAEHVAVGALVVVRPGERIATDGVVVEGGSSAVDVSMLTGESVPLEVAPGDEVSGGTVAQDSFLLVVRATRVGSDTALARITALVTAAQSGKAPVQRLADRVSAVFVPVVLGDRGAHPARLGPDHRVAAGGASARPSPCWSSRARAPWVSPRPPPCWSGPGGAPSSACSCAGPRCSSRPGAPTRWCWTRPAR